MTSYPTPDPAALPDDRAGETWRYHIDEDLVPQKRAVLKHEPTDYAEEISA